jgi:hypothetical protein
VTISGWPAGSQAATRLEQEVLHRLDEVQGLQSQVAAAAAVARAHPADTVGPVAGEVLRQMRGVADASEEWLRVHALQVRPVSVCAWNWSSTTAPSMVGVCRRETLVCPAAPAS